MHDPEIVLRQSINFTGSIVVVLLGLWVWTLRPRTPTTRAFALFTVAWGTMIAINNVTGAVHPPDVVELLVDVPVQMALLAGTVAMVRHFPRPLARHDRPAVAAAVATIALLAGAGYSTYDWRWDSAEAVLGGVNGLMREPAQAGIYAFVMLFALRFLRERDPLVRRQLALTSAGLLVYVGTAAGAGINMTSSPLEVPFSITSEPWLRLFVALTASGLWLVALRGPDKRIARNMALLTCGFVLYGLAVEMGWVWGAGGVTRIVMTAVLAYAIVRHQVLGIDVKVRWTISRSTVAAIFIAVFFLASEGAQLLFGQANELIGLLAAGALVFAMSPLQRAADRLAERAVPLATPSPVPLSAPAPSKSEDAYRRAVRLALRDRRLTHGEEIHLFHVAEALGVPAGRAMELRHEVEREQEVGASGG